MSFRDYQQGSSRPAPSRTVRPGRPELRVNTQPARTGHSEQSITGLSLYGKLRLVPSTSYESSNCHDHQKQKLHDDECDNNNSYSLEHSSCSSDESLSRVSLNPNSHPPPRRTSTPSSASGRGIPGFSTKRRNRVDPLVNSHGKKGFFPNHPHSSSSLSSPLAVSPAANRYNDHCIRGWSHTSKSEAETINYLHPTASDSLRRPPPPQASQQHRTSPRKKDTKYSELSIEVKHFQKMVTQLQGLVDQSGVSPEMQWRSRILLTSAQDADRDIADKLYEYEKSLVDVQGHSKEARTAQTAFMKLHRDFRRAHQAFTITLCDYERRQRTDISLLGANHNQSINVRNPDALMDPAQVLQQEQEDFFERAMREREEEINQVNQKMHKVNEIYRDLALLVAGQQEQFDALGNRVQDAKDNVEGGLRHIEYARDRLCAMGDVTFDHGSNQCGGMNDVKESEVSVREPKGTKNTSSYERLSSSSSVKESEVFHWTMPFQTYQKDMKSAKIDFLGLGGDLSSFRCGEMQCGSLRDVGARSQADRSDDSVEPF